MRVKTKCVDLESHAPDGQAMAIAIGNNTVVSPGGLNVPDGEFIRLLINVVAGDNLAQCCHIRHFGNEIR